MNIPTTTFTNPQRLSENLRRSNKVPCFLANVRSNSGRFWSTKRSISSIIFLYFLEYRWKDYHEQMLKPKYGEDIETSITPDLYNALYEQVKARTLAYIPELADHQDKPIAMLLFKAGMCKEIRKRQRGQ